MGVAAARLAKDEATGATIVVAGERLVGDPLGGLYWPRMELLVVADLHLEKGAAFAAKGVMLPPYDTPDTLDLVQVKFI